MTCPRIYALLVLFFTSNSALLVLNKVAIRAMPHAAGLLFVQILTTALIVLLSAKLSGTNLSMNPSATVCRSYVLVAAVWCGTIYSNFHVLDAIGVNSFIVLRCSTPLLVSIMDWLFLQRSLPSFRSTMAIGGILVSSLAYTYTKFASADIAPVNNVVSGSFTAQTWCFLWLLFFLTDVTYIKHVVDSHACNEVERTLYQNTFALPFLAIPCVMKVDGSHHFDILGASSSAKFALGLSCIAGAVLSFTGMSLRSHLSATAFTILGIACKMGSTLLNEIFVEPEKDLRILSSVFAIILCSALYKQAPLRIHRDQSVGSVLK